MEASSQMHDNYARNDSASPAKRSKKRHFHITGFSIAGTKNPSNQDRYDIKKQGNFPAFGVYDGHGGSEAARFCKENLLVNLQTSLNVNRDFKSVFKSEFVKIQGDMHKEHDSWPRVGVLPSTAGTTASVLVLNNHHALVANVGDSPILRVCRFENGELDAVELGKSHKPGTGDDEHIIRYGGQIIGQTAVFRTRILADCGSLIGHRSVSLNMTRALGNFYSMDPIYNQYAIQPVPTVASYKLDYSMDCFLVVASDGVSDVLSNKEIADFLKSTYGGADAYANGNIPGEIAENAAKMLCIRAQERWGLAKRDDCTAIVLALVN